MSLRIGLRRTAFMRGAARPGELEAYRRLLGRLLEYPLVDPRLAPAVRRRQMRRLAELLAGRRGLDPRDRDVAAAIEAAIDAALDG